MYKPGIRVGTMQSATKDEVNLFGYGIYEGDFVPPHEVVGPFGTMDDVEQSDGTMGLSNPRIRLDDGDVVWGCECWWGAEETFREAIEGRRVIKVSVADYRHRCNAEPIAAVEDEDTDGTG